MKESNSEIIFCMALLSFDKAKHEEIQGKFVKTAYL